MTDCCRYTRIHKPADEVDSSPWDWESNIYYNSALFECCASGLESLHIDDYPLRGVFWVRLRLIPMPCIVFLASTAHFPWKGCPQELATGDKATFYYSDLVYSIRDCHVFAWWCDVIFVGFPQCKVPCCYILTYTVLGMDQRMVTAKKAVDVLDHISPNRKELAVFAGDFNADYHPVRILSSHGFHEVWSTNHWIISSLYTTLWLNTHYDIYTRVNYRAHNCRTLYTIHDGFVESDWYNTCYCVAIVLCTHVCDYRQVFKLLKVTPTHTHPVRPSAAREEIHPNRTIDWITIRTPTAGTEEKGTPAVGTEKGRHL